MAAVPPPPQGYQNSGGGSSSYGGDVPTEDVHEKSSGEGPPQASAPPVSAMDRVSGYENTNFDTGRPASQQPAGCQEAPRSSSWCRVCVW